VHRKGTGSEDMKRSDLVQCRHYGSVAGCCERRSDSLSSKREGEYPDQLSDYLFLAKSTCSVDSLISFYPKIFVILRYRTDVNGNNGQL
jgi:hypothetical protein